MSRVFIGVGSNEGDREGLISRAVRALGAVSGIRIVQMAMIAETEPVGGPPQGPYLNTVVELETTCEPRRLFSVLQGIERRLGRKPSPERWSSRPIDLDLLLYDDRVIEEPGLTVPHPRMHERIFVLAPLAELAGAVTIPRIGRSVVECLAGCAERLAELSEGS